MKKMLKKILKPLVDMVRGRRVWKKYQSKKDTILMERAGDLLSLGRRDLPKFKEVKRFIEEENIKRLRTKETVNVGFVAYSSAMWSCDALFKKIDKSKKFNPVVIVCDLEEGTAETRNKIHKDAVEFFNKKGYKTVDARKIPAEEYLQKMDLLIYLTPFRISQKNLNIQEVPLRILTVYITYSFMIAEREEKFNLPMYQLTWKFFTDTLIYKDLMGEKCHPGNENAEFCGFMKMDTFLEKSKRDSAVVWKGSPKAKRIIYAPHHSVFDEKAGFSTFDLNGKFMLELAKKYKDETSWIIKPHPLLRGRIVKNGFFKNVEEYDEYLKEWDKLPNAKVVMGGDYLEWFKSSDSMILDSISFLVEYQYAHKPLLLLTRDTQRFNAFGKKLKEVLYQANGDDYKTIEDYLKNVVLSGDDVMKEKREKFFDENLNYYKYNNGRLASDYVYEFLDNTLGGQDA